MTGYQSKKAMAQAKLEDDDDIQTYTRPWVGLTAEEAAKCWTTSAVETWHNFETALKDKNT
jgi:hypothetical protein